jgi:hypothetical protein
MGAWGWDIFSSDHAVDIRADWRDGIVAGEDPARLTERLVFVYGDPSPADGADGAEFWIVLAAVQHASGVLQAGVRARALEAIACGGDGARWGDRAPHRTAVLHRLERKLARAGGREPSGPPPAGRRDRPQRPTRP